jgi:tetratricopeptide (TPR) repeat protein
MKKFLLIFLLGTYPVMGAEQGNYIDYTYNHIRYKFIHIIPDENISSEANITTGTVIGKTIALPSSRSVDVNRNNIIIESEKLYYEKRFADAVKLLDTIYDSEKENPFFLNAYARTLFWLRDAKSLERSFMYYTKIVQIIDVSTPHEADELVVDLWFSEVYWKLGCLYLDRRDYPNAAKEIGKFLSILPEFANNNTKLMEQVCSYMTEVYYFMKDPVRNEEYYQKTLITNPRNEYVLKFRLKTNGTPSQ